VTLSSPVVSTVTPRRRTDYLYWKPVQQSVRNFDIQILVKLTGGDLMKVRENTPSNDARR